MKFPRRSKDLDCRKNWEFLELGRVVDLKVNPDPGNPDVDALRLFVRLAAGKMELVVKNDLGDEAILWTEP